MSKDSESPEAAAGTPRLQVTGLSKTFAGVTVLHDARLRVQPGEVHALVGQNGSGKSTLIKLISGVYSADPGGDVYVDGTRIGTPVRTGRLHDEGLAFVHQDLGLVLDLTVRENVRVGRHAVNRYTRWIDRGRDAAAVRESLEFLGLGHISPEAKVGTLRPSDRVGVAVARALQGRRPGAGVVVFDESSRGIPQESLADFYGLIRLLSAQGTAVILVSHNLREVLHIADRVTALRNGRIVETGVPVADLDESGLTRLVLGRDGDLDDLVAQMPSAASPGGLRVENLSGGRVRDVSLDVRRGEVVGVTGSVDSGLAALAPLLAGRAGGRGSLAIDDRRSDMSNWNLLAALAAGLSYIPQDRHGEGLATALTAQENVTLPHLARRGKRWWIGTGWQKSETDGVMARFAVHPADRNAPVATFSGGNQQKLLMGKWLLDPPAVLVLDDPTQAVDVGARIAVLRAARQAAVDGSAVLLCSHEVDDLAAVCDRVLILDRGVVVRELTRPFTADTVFAEIFPDSERALS
ncbi:ATP-binding cassette domain-containing protein [Microbacterium sp. CPCC 204701]|uniref:ATP-binding cassette domain-containing protein n=1 Tax=Microbacterium sp. CPCC 204701 TaxID=2493084 RepID=UPI0013E3A783|nr:sugar ABC transporter ATP-binding protein [Microbacterium sp. CPCC 204701]